LTDVLHEAGPIAGHSPDQERPLGAYAVLMATYLAGVAGFSAWLRASGREVPDRVPPADAVLVAVATHKASRLITKDRVSSAFRAPFTTFQGDAGPGEVDEAARGTGLRRAVGELLVCPHCMDVWLATAAVAGLIVAPRLTRWLAGMLSIVFGADVLQIAYAKAEQTLG
jgi:hypothetical protein